MSEKIKVLQYTGAMNRAGAETLLMNVYRNIDREKYEFHFISHTKNKCDYDEEIVKLGGRILYIDQPNIICINSFKQNFKKILNENGPYNAIHSHMQLLNGLILKEATKNNIRNRISHAHLNGDYCSNSFIRKIYRLKSKNLINKYSTEKLACSKLAGDYLYSGNKFKMLNNAINIDDFNFNNKLDYMYDELNLSKDIKFITHIGRFVEAKNHDFIIDVFERVVNINGKFRLLLIGQGKLLNEVKQKVKERGLERYVFFLGLRTDINKVLASTDVFFMPSILEGLPVVLVEAQAAGVPCIVSNNIPKEADLGLEIIKYLDLSESKNKWAKAIINSIYNKKSFETRKNKIIESGYNLDDNIQFLSEIYSR